MDPDYLIRVDSDHMVKFCGDRPRELGDLMADFKKTSRLKQNAFGTNVPGLLTRSQAVARIADRTASRRLWLERQFSLTGDLTEFLQSLVRWSTRHYED